jgi:AcrR family transcriptional regulator
VRGIGGRTLDADDKRDLLLDAAERAFGRLGYAGTTMATLAAEAQVTRPTVYAYYDSKDEVFVAVAERVRAEFLLVQERADTTSPVRTIRSTLAANLELFVRHHAVLTVIAHQALSDDRLRRLHEDIYARVHRRHARFLQRMASSGKADLPVPATTVSEAVTGMTSRFAELVVADPSRKGSLTAQLVAAYLRLTALHD